MKFPCQLAIFVTLWMASPGLSQTISLVLSNTVKDRHVAFYARPTGAAPQQMATVVQTDDAEIELRQRQEEWEAEFATNHDLIRSKAFPFADSGDQQRQLARAIWIPFSTNLTADLGPGDGGRFLWVGLRNSPTDYPRWECHHIFVRSTPAFIGITFPRQSVITQPMILLKGICPVPLFSIRYTIFDQTGSSTGGGEGLVNNQYYDSLRGRFTTNYFTCLNLNLTAGTNTIVLRCTDEVGTELVTNLVYVLDVQQDKTPPVISIDWPRVGAELSERSFTVRGALDDVNEKIVGQISANGVTNTVNGLVEWSHTVDGAGYYWIEGLPVSIGTNYFTLTATDAAGNISTTNRAVIGNDGPVITMDPVAPAENLWRPFLDLTGKVRPADNQVWINGVQAAVTADGTWRARHVPVVSPNVGTACFEMTTISPDKKKNGTVKLKEVVSAQANLGTNAMTLNASSPACGVFKLHLTDSIRQPFMLLTSTNLTQWTALLTNTDPAAVFDFTDTNAGESGCRFFRVVPMQ